ncbi:geranylgeranyl diphosphate synthase type I [Leucobacter luti]|uniref:Geranylgeranyl diphosphate synthase type I n=2 Tax=Leucobacter luti TaxID=340320 RepID=A0A4Q7TPG5_9MICO|nr:polyprenyl synthetase family protein [Leucobacter luti]RZT61182.1 geranylgeranyl diphosphate synthase type I [Leucobacter luti]
MRLAGLIQERISDTLARHREELTALGPDALPLLDEALGFLTGGKRFRAQFAVLGFRAARELDTAGDVTGELSRVLDAACALEFFHAAALIHDDVIDRSDTRRGRPSVHRLFGAMHRQHGWRGSADHFGLAGAILLGDLLQSWADELMQAACDATPDRDAARRAREHFNRMRSEVAVGQYLDVLEEQQPEFAGHAEQLERSTRVLVFKSAKYSVEAPILIGAALAGASAELESALADFGLPVGVAFQLRDDQLGVFGDEELTGKPIGDDLIEGKRTVLVALARENLPVTQRRIFDDLLGTELDAEQVAILQRTIRESGAVERVEEMISRNIERATDALTGAPIRGDAAAQLTELAERAARRTH